MGSPWDFNPSISSSSSQSSGGGIPNITTPELKPSLIPETDGNSWQKTALQSAGLIPLMPKTDTLLKTQSAVSGWQQTNTSSPNATIQQTTTFKFAIQDKPQPAETNQWLAAPQTPEETKTGANSKTGIQNLLKLYKASAPKAKQGDGKQIVGGQGNFGSIEKGGMSGLFSSSTETVEE